MSIFKKITVFFLEERSSISLGFFRLAVAFTVGAVMLPTFVHLEDTYLSTAFKQLNTTFFPLGVLEWVQQSPDGLVKAMVGVFCVVWLMFLVGLFSQISAILTFLGCYYFYALNSFAMGTLSWDILLVTFFLICVTPYPGDYFSLDAFLWGREDQWRRKRPVFLQRLLQLEIGLIFFYTALYKTTGEGNWFTDNPIYYLMNTPYPGVVKTFILKDILKFYPTICYAIGVSIVLTEYALIFLLYWRKTRPAAIYLGILFHILLILTLDVPATFLFLFPPQLLLFINNNTIDAWIDRARAANRNSVRHKLIYDGHCRLCQMSVHRLRLMDIFGAVEYVDLHRVDDLSFFHPDLDREEALTKIFLVDRQGRLSGGFFAVRRLSWSLPMVYSLIPFLYLPGMGLLGPFFYRVIARNRYLIFGRTTCQTDSCSIK